jgi:hypothetical protein
MLGYPSGYSINVWSSAAIQVDDMALYPETVDFIANTYKIPFGKSAETDAARRY